MLFVGQRRQKSQTREGF